jgi:hypothetical protein
MKKFILSTILLSVTGLAQAGATESQQLKALNDEVQHRADILQYQHNVIVTQTDKNNIKKQVIVEQLKADNSGASAQKKVGLAINTFEITDPTDQRDIIIQYGFGSGDGAEPPK